MPSHMARLKANRLIRALAAALALVLLLPLAGCGGSAELRTGRKLIKEYLAGRRPELVECYVEALRPDGTKSVNSDFVKGQFRADGKASVYDFAVNTVTGEVYTAERLPEFYDCCVRAVASQLGLDAGDWTAQCQIFLHTQPWQTPREEWPWAHSSLGSVLPVGVTDLDAYARQCIADENASVTVRYAIRAGELYEGRWSERDLAGWNNTEVTLYGFADEGDPLPPEGSFPGDISYTFTGPRMILRPGSIEYRPGE